MGSRSSCDRRASSPACAHRVRATTTQHPFHRRMDAGELTREELQRWVGEPLLLPEDVIPLKDAAILANCPEVEVRRAVGPAHPRPRRDGRHSGRHRVLAAARRGARGHARGAALGAPGVLPAVRYAVDAYVNFARTGHWIEAVASSLTELFGPGSDPRAPRGARASLPVDRPRGARVLPRAARAGAARRAARALDLTVERCRTPEQRDAAVAALRFKTEVLWAQLDAIERGDTQPPGTLA